MVTPPCACPGAANATPALAASTAPLRSTILPSAYVPFVWGALFGVGEARFDDAYFSTSFYTARPKEFRFAGDTPQAVRVSDPFAQFAPGEAKPNRSYSSLTTFVR